MSLGRDDKWCERCQKAHYWYHCDISTIEYEVSQTEKNNNLQNINEPTVIRNCDEILSRIETLKKDRDCCKNLCNKAYEKYQLDCKNLGYDKADSREYLEINKRLIILNTQIMELEWVLGLYS